MGLEQDVQDAPILLQPGKGAEEAGRESDELHLGRIAHRGAQGGARDDEEGRAVRDLRPARPPRAGDAGGRPGMGLGLFAKAPSPALTAVKVPEGIDGGAVTKRLRDTYGVTVAGGQDHLKGKIFRLAHLGYFDTFDVIVGLSATEMTMKDLGAPVALGKEWRRPRRFWREGREPDG